MMPMFVFQSGPNDVPSIGASYQISINQVGQIVLEKIIFF